MKKGATLGLATTIIVYRDMQRSAGMLREHRCYFLGREKKHYGVQEVSSLFMPYRKEAVQVVVSSLGHTVRSRKNRILYSDDFHRILKDSKEPEFSYWILYCWNYSNLFDEQLYLCKKPTLKVGRTSLNPSFTLILLLYSVLYSRFEIWELGGGSFFN